MRVLIVARCKDGRYAPFITEQVRAIEEEGVTCRYYGIEGKGIRGYLRQLPGLRKVIREFRPDVVHAHYGLCGVLANCQRHVPVVTTYHGSDINDPKVLRLSQIAIRRSRFNVFVSQRNLNIARPEKNFALIPCGIDLDDYPLIDKSDAREQLGLAPDKKYVLFAGAFDNPVKNVAMAREAMALVPSAELLELKGYSRPEVATLMQAVDTLLMTSHTEGSPQVIKEALACGCPIVSVDVGDVREVTAGVEGCLIVDRDAAALARGVESACRFEGRTQGRERIVERKLTNEHVARQLIKIYQTL